MTRTEFLREQTLSGKNKCRRRPFPSVSVADRPGGIAERKAFALCVIFEQMPIFIGQKEMIVGTRTLFTPHENNQDGHDLFLYDTYTHVPYINGQDVATFACDQSYQNKTHYVPDFGIVLEKGIDGILEQAREKKQEEGLCSVQTDFLRGVEVAYNGLKHMIGRYADEALSLAQTATGEDKAELLEIARVCQKIGGGKPDTFREAVQLLWFTHLGTMIESFDFINYGRLDVILGKYLKDTPRQEAQQILECLLLKMYDQADLATTYLGKYSAQLVVTLGGVLPNGENAVNEVTMLFLDAVGNVRLPDPEFNLRISSQNPPEFLEKAAELTVSGCNFISYYNDDLFVKSLHQAGIPLVYARDYGFDLCQDMNIPGKSDFFVASSPSLAQTLMELLQCKRDFASFEELLQALKTQVAEKLSSSVHHYRASQMHLNLYAQGKLKEYFDLWNGAEKRVHRHGFSPMAPLPLLSPLYHGSLEQALDIAYEPYPVKEKGVFFGTATEAINSLAAIKKTVYIDKRFTLEQVYEACVSNFEGENGEYMRQVLWHCPKWGNDDDFVDSIAKDFLEFCLKECRKYQTHFGGQILAGIHQPHPVYSGKRLMATPEGRKAGEPVAVTLTPESGTMKNGPTAVLRSASKIDPALIQWNYCVMVNYYASVFQGNEGKEIFQTLLKGYFQAGGMQHQPNITNVEELKRAQAEPEKYKDLIVRLWGVSAHFVDLEKELQDEMIARFS